MTHYFIEFRFQGKAKHEMKKLAWEVDRRFRLRQARRRRPIPHVTLIAPFYSKDQRKIVSDFKGICSKYDLIKFKLRGYGCFEKSRVVYTNIIPSKEMTRFQKELLHKLRTYCKMSQTDSSTYKPHATIAMKLTPSQFSRIKSYVNRERKPSQNFIMARATLIKGQKILYEYDFLLRKLLTRREAKSKGIYTKTINKIKRLDKTQEGIAKDLGILSKIKRLIGIK